MKCLVRSGLAATFAAVLAAAPAQAGELAVWRADSIVWQIDRPNGTKLALLEGDWNKPGMPFTYAFYMPADVWFQPHTHPADARIVVLRGTLLLGTGDKLDKDKTTALSVGDAGFVPAGLPHYEGSKGVTILLGTAIAPWGTTFVEAGLMSSH